MTLPTKGREEQPERRIHSGAPPDEKPALAGVSLHMPVMADAVLRYLAPKAGDSYLDLTAGYGGHASLVMERTLNPAQAVLIDRDANAIRELHKRFQGGETIIQSDFASASHMLGRQGRRFDLIFADLGVSSPHLNQPSRGFAFNAEGPLDMRMDQRQELTADRIVNGYTEDELADILRRYGEEPKARTIARAVIAARPVLSTAELARIVARQWPGHSRVHPATRTFQAIRVAVNDELRQLEKALPLWINLLTPGGRLAIISFQSLEDRLVKNLLADKAGGGYDSEIRLLTKRPITAESTETVHNPRSRSAKLRAAVKLK